MSSTPVGIPNPTTMLSYQKAVDAKLVDKSYQKVMAKKVEAYAGNIGWCPDAEFSRASAEVVCGIGPKYAEALGGMSVFNFATTRGGRSFAGLEPIIGKEGVTNLRNLQAALKACMLVEDGPVTHQVSAARFVELFATDFNGYDVSKMVGPTLVELLNSGIGGDPKEAVEQYSSLVAFELLGSSLKAFEQMDDYVGMSVEDIGYMVQNAYHGALAGISNEAKKMQVAERSHALMNQHASYLPEELREALGLEQTEPEPAPASMTSERFMTEYSTSFFGRNVEEITIEDLMRDLESATDPGERRQLLGDLVAFISFGLLYGAISMHEQGTPAVEIADAMTESLGGLRQSGQTDAEKAYVNRLLGEVGDVYFVDLPEVVASALSEVWPA